MARVQLKNRLKMEDIKKVAVIGAGTMGHGIAQSFAYAGYQVSMMSRSRKTLDRAMSLIKASLESMADLLRSMGKKPIIFNGYVSGYVVSRLQIALQREIYYLLDEGHLTAREVDDACIWGLAMRMMIVGAVGRIDYSGIGLSVKNLKNPTCPPTPLDYQPKMIFDLEKAGHLGVKTGKGFYDYGGKPEAELCAMRDEKLLKMLKFSMDLGDALPGAEDPNENRVKEAS